jgi:hypothetical protein
MFEAFASEYAKSYVDEDAVQSKLSVAEQKLADAEKALAESEERVAKMLRESKMEEILSPLTGKKREQMAMILKNVDTSRLEESYKYFIGRIMKEEETAPAAKPLNEATAAAQTTVVTGNKPDTGTQAKSPQAIKLDEMKRLAGIRA